MSVGSQIGGAHTRSFEYDTKFVEEIAAMMDGNGPNACSAPHNFSVLLLLSMLNVVDSHAALAIAVAHAEHAQAEELRGKRIFISYSSVDSDDVFKLLLSSLGVAGFDVFDPINLVNPSRAEMQAEVQKSKVLIAVLSPGYFESQWCCAEAMAGQSPTYLRLTVKGVIAWELFMLPFFWHCRLGSALPVAVCLC